VTALLKGRKTFDIMFMTVLAWNFWVIWCRMCKPSRKEPCIEWCWYVCLLLWRELKLYTYQSSTVSSLQSEMVQFAKFSDAAVLLA
jgi:hypothetical protein